MVKIRYDIVSQLAGTVCHDTTMVGLPSEKISAELYGTKYFADDLKGLNGVRTEMMFKQLDEIAYVMPAIMYSLDTLYRVLTKHRISSDLSYFNLVGITSPKVLNDVIAARDSGVVPNPDNWDIGKVKYWLNKTERFILNTLYTDVPDEHLYENFNAINTCKDLELLRNRLRNMLAKKYEIEVSVKYEGYPELKDEVHPEVDDEDNDLNINELLLYQILQNQQLILQKLEEGVPRKKKR